MRDAAFAAKPGRDGPLRALRPVPARLFGITKPHSPEPDRSMAQASFSTGSRSHLLPQRFVAPVHNGSEAPLLLLMIKLGHSTWLGEQFRRACVHKFSAVREQATGHHFILAVDVDLPILHHQFQQVEQVL